MNKNILFQCELPDFRIIPYVRMTKRGKYIKRQAQRYIENQERLAWLLALQWNNHVITSPCILSYNVHLGHKRRVDNDNITKAIQDALQKAGIIKNDSQIRGTYKTALYQNGLDRVVIQLQRYNAKKMRI